jgi:hypothetical protein
MYIIRTAANDPLLASGMPYNAKQVRNISFLETETVTHIMA